MKFESVTKAALSLRQIVYYVVARVSGWFLECCYAVASVHYHIASMFQTDIMLVDTMLIRVVKKVIRGQ